jgi:hypothetical protein
MSPVPASRVYAEFVDLVRRSYRADRVHDGEFGAMMEVALVNDGPVTIIVDSGEKSSGASASSSADPAASARVTESLIVSSSSGSESSSSAEARAAPKDNP